MERTAAGRADAPGFARSFFSWVASHRRVRMISYNQGGLPNGPFRLGQYPRSQAVIRDAMRSPRFEEYAAEWRVTPG